MNRVLGIRDIIFGARFKIREGVVDDLLNVKCGDLRIFSGHENNMKTIAFISIVMATNLILG